MNEEKKAKMVQAFAMLVKADALRSEICCGTPCNECPLHSEIGCSGNLEQAMKDYSEAVLRLKF